MEWDNWYEVKNTQRAALEDGRRFHGHFAATAPTEGAADTCTFIHFLFLLQKLGLDISGVTKGV